MEEQVKLEAYADQNRALISNQRNNEALAICKHILRYFPKHIETYRQMGEAYLNLEDYESAKDMFRRVLSADPEDLVAYIGLSTIFEQQRFYEESIWHLERAYELSPENLEIQRELLRLYPEVGMRIQQRVQMTPGALARLYSREGLYPQAIQELRLILGQSPSRFDAFVALAETMWNAGQLREAADMSEKILATLPYCLKANLILGTVWKESGLTEGDLHLQRAQEVDPTNQIAQRLLGARSTLPVLQVSVPRYVEGTLQIEQSTTTLPTASAQVDTAQETWSFTEPTHETASAEADFFGSTPSLFDSQPALAETAPAVPSEQPSTDHTVDDLPDWLTAGYSPSSEEKPQTEEITTSEDKTSLETWFAESQATEEKPETPPQEMTYEQAQEMLSRLLSGATTEEPQTETPPPAEAKIEPATGTEEEVPEWLKGWQIAPVEPAQTKETSESTATPSPSQDLPDWLGGSNIEPEETAPTETAESSADGSSDWLSALQVAPEDKTETEPTAQAEELPDWLSRIKPGSETEPATGTAEPGTTETEALPDWLSSLQPISEEPATPVVEETPAPSRSEWTSTPVTEEKAEPSEEKSFVDFLANLGQEPETSNEPAQSIEHKPEPTGEKSFADFLSNLGQEPATSSEPTPATSGLPDFLAGLPTEPEEQPAQAEYPVPSFLSKAETAMPVAPEPTAPPEMPLPDFLSGAPVEEKPTTPSESYPVPSFLETQEPVVPIQAITPTEEWVPPEMPSAPVAVDAAPSILVETLPTRVEKVKPKKPKRVIKGSERLVQARQHRDTNEIDKALAEYDYIVQRAPRLIKDVIDDLEVLIQRIDAPLKTHRILGDAYTRNDRLSDALEQYRFVMDHSPQASE